MRNARSIILYACTPLFLATFTLGCGGSDSSTGDQKGKAFESGQGQGGQKGGRSMRGGGDQRGRGNATAGGPRSGQGNGRGMRGNADVDVGKEELKTFVAISKKVVPLQKEMRKDQRKAIKESSLSKQRYSRIMMAMRKKKDAGMSQEEKKEVQRLRKDQRKRMEELQKKTKKKVKESEGMEWKRFQTIATALSQDKKLKQRFDRMRRKMKGQGDTSSNTTP